MSWLPYTADMLTGYFVQDDIYMTYTEYYGDGTVYGLRHIHFPDGTPGYGLGPGMSRADLVTKGMVVPEERAGAVGIDIVPVAEAAPEAVPEAEAEAVPEAEAEAEAEAVALPTVCSEACICDTEPEKPLQKVTVKVNGVTVSLNTTTTKEVTVDVDDKAATVTFSL